MIKLVYEVKRRAEKYWICAKTCRRGGALLRLERCGFLAAKQLGSEDAKRHSLLGLRKFDLFRKIVDILSLVKRNILISPLEGEKKFLSELCELRKFREGYKKYKALDRATECAMTCLLVLQHLSSRTLFRDLTWAAK